MTNEAIKIAKAAADNAIIGGATDIAKAINDYEETTGRRYPAGTIIKREASNIIASAKVSGKRILERREAEELAHAELAVAEMKREVKVMKQETKEFLRAPGKKLSAHREWLWEGKDLKNERLR